MVSSTSGSAANDAKIDLFIIELESFLLRLMVELPGIAPENSQCKCDPTP